MPLPKPKTGEKQDEWINRCMGNENMQSEFPDGDQRLGVCFSTWRKAKGEKKDDTIGKEIRIETSNVERLMIQKDQAEVRFAPGKDGEPDDIIVGYASVFYDGTEATEYQLRDDMVERIMPGAFDAVLEAKKDVRGLFNHDPDQILGRTSAGTMALRSDTKGLAYAIDLGDTTVARDVAEHIRRGDVDGSSFAFRVKGQLFRTEYGIDIRQIIEVGPLLDVGPVTFPAYTATQAKYRQELEIAQEVRSGLEAQRPPVKKAVDDPETQECQKWVEGLDTEIKTE